MTIQTDTLMMKRALMLGASARGTTAPNPAIGCVIARRDCILGEGATQPGGRPHAEAVALSRAGEAARGATLYVTLEPCAHLGRSPPCTDAIIASGIKRVVVALAFDPDPRVSGRGVEKLRAAGISVETGLLGDQAWTTLAGFFSRVTRQRALASLLFHDLDAAPLDNADTGLTAMRSNYDLVLSATPHQGTNEAWPPHFLLRSARDDGPLALRALHNSLGAGRPRTDVFAHLDDLLAHLGAIGHNDVLIEASRHVLPNLATEENKESAEAEHPTDLRNPAAPLSKPFTGEMLVEVRETSALGSRS
ncbi:bifunctional diaminohydroxyphosphoribosylaminopyrimidine deaminase/5-amino-6-(5-phosphoribosylamino)uracil reductase RibD [Stappia stellulata]|uniref:bifunctional diaminohydroxyphosphoribosylaminopyrimidine deaminase/5-amino-6-(5-phosphoribosylamino)uracil reductase RibD n=1 Tax=Stappia stellulata TaxID=71235 RepID=UPI003CCC3669